MMLKPSPSRNQRTKSLKVKHCLQICLLLAICVWLLYQAKQSYDNEAKLEKKSVSTQVSEKGEKSPPMLKMGRKDIKSRLPNEELDLEDEESKEKETDEEIEEGEKDKITEEEVEPQQLQDLIDEDDKDE